MAKNVFNTVQVAGSPANWFNLAHDVKLSMQMGRLVPILCSEVIPGDLYKIQSQSLIRFAPMIAPVMHSISVSIHYFFVPNRLVWPNWETFVSPPLATTVPPAVPYVSPGSSSFPESSLADYLGLPPNKALGPVSAIPFAGYQMIYNNYYKDQNNNTGTVRDQLNDGAQTGTGSSDLYDLRYRSWGHDYFTSALPWAQKGAPVSLPIANVGDVPVYGVSPVTVPSQSYMSVAISDPSSIPELIIPKVVGATGGEGLMARTSDLDFASTTINDLRTAMRTQEFLERQARGGSRYIEQIRMQFGVKSSDQRLDRPEFIGGTKAPVIISEVLQTSSTDAETPQGSMAGHGISANSGKTFSYYAEEHGYIFGIMSIIPTTAYQQGIPRHFLRTDVYDYAWPIFGNLGEQEIYNKEIYVDSTDGKDNDTFGYIPRYSEYRYIPSRVAGEFRSTLAFWHLGRIFQNRPTLNAGFNLCQPRTDIFAAGSSDNQNLWCHVFNNVKVRRKLPKYGTPTL